MLSFSAAKNLHVLQSVLAVVALPRGVTQILGPHKNCVTGLSKFERNFLPLMTLDKEFGALNFGQIKIVNENGAILVTLRQKVRSLPSEKILGRVLRICASRIKRTKLHAIKSAVNLRLRGFL